MRQPILQMSLLFVRKRQRLRCDVCVFHCLSSIGDGATGPEKTRTDSSRSMRKLTLDRLGVKEDGSVDSNDFNLKTNRRAQRTTLWEGLLRIPSV